MVCVDVITDALLNVVDCLTVACRMNRRKADFKFAYKFLEDEV